MSEKQASLAWHSPQFFQDAHSVASQRVRFIEHAGKRILVVDFSRAELDLIKAVAAECLHIMVRQPANSVLSLCEVEAIPFSTEALSVGKELTDLVQPYALRTALSGVAGFRSFVLQAVADAAQRPIRLFKERPEALTWLVTDAGSKA